MIQIDIPMPKMCYDCPCHDGERGKCQITGEYYFDEIPRNCPIKEVQSTGEDLILWEDFIESICEALHKVSRPQGEWINKHEWDNGFLERECSLCGAMKPILMHTAKINYCPNCGARMKGADDDPD